MSINLHSSVSPLDPKASEIASNNSSIQKKGIFSNRIVKPIKHMASSVASSLHLNQGSKAEKSEKVGVAKYADIEFHLVRKGRFDGENKEVRYDIQRSNKNKEFEIHDIFTEQAVIDPDTRQPSINQATGETYKKPMVQGFTKDMGTIVSALLEAIDNGSIPRKDGLFYLKKLQADLNGLGKNLTMANDIRAVNDLKLRLMNNMVSILKVSIQEGSISSKEGLQTIKDLESELRVVDKKFDNSDRRIVGFADKNTLETLKIRLSELKQECKSEKLIHSPSLGNHSVKQGKASNQNYNLKEKPDNGIKLLDTANDSLHKTFELGAGEHGYTLLIKVPNSRQKQE
jgi:hypothetical protein